MSDHASTQDLIHRIESKDRKFRTAQALFMIMLLAVLTGIIFVQFRTLDTVKQQLVASKATAAETTKQSDDQRDKIIRRLDCMVAFFSQTDRTNLSIADIDKCSLNRDSNVQQFFSQPESTPSAKSPNINQPSSGSTNNGATTNDGTPATVPSNQAPTPVPTPVTVQPTPPLKVLGVPICIPFTEVCVR
jgi:hypothetical protein